MKNGRASGTRKLIFEQLEVRRVMAAMPQLFDIEAGSGSSTPSEFVEFNGQAYFAATDSTHGRELWKSDGTAAGLELVADINPGAFNGIRFNSPNGALNWAFLTPLGDSLLFAASDGTSGFDLWKSDGTTAGTALLKDIHPESTSPGKSEIVELARVGEQVFFSAGSASNGINELWVSDGSPGGTSFVANIGTISTAGTGDTARRYFTPFGNEVFFRGALGNTVMYLWKSDGTPTGTLEVPSSQLGVAPRLLSSASAAATDPQFTMVGDSMFFRADDAAAAAGKELWKSDGTPAGTFRVKDIRLGATSSSLANLTNVSGALYFSAHDGVRTGLWRSDGTEVGTYLVKELTFAGTTSSRQFVNVDGVLYFAASDATSGLELWKSDGTEGGTVHVANINPNASSSPSHLTNIDGVLYFAANDGTTGVELWKSDGTAAGTVRVTDIAVNAASSSPRNLFLVGNKLFFSADDGVNGRELWVLDLSEPIPGDYDADSDVDGTDFLVWQRELGNAVEPDGAGADGDESGTVDAGDLAVWQSHFGEPQAAAAVSTSSAAAASPASLDAVYAAGDFTSLFAESGFFRPARRARRAR